MKEIPIIFRTEMVKDILDGTKNLTFRVIKPQPQWLTEAWYWRHAKYDNGDGVDYFHSRQITSSVFELMAKCCPYGQAGDRLWVRETWKAGLREDGAYLTEYKAGGFTLGVCDPVAHRFAHYEAKWQPSIHMFRWASRITLERSEPAYVKRTLDITEEEAKLCGFESLEDYHCYWNYLNKKRGFPFADNVWVWGVPFGAMSYRGK